MGWMSDERGLEKCAANYVPLTPLSHLNRAADIYADREALVCGARRWTYTEHRARVTQLASALVGAGIEPGDVVSAILPNIAAQVEAHLGVPAAGAVLNAINTRLDVDTVAYILGHSGAKIVLVDTQFLALAVAATERMEGAPPRLIEVCDPGSGLTPSGKFVEYEQFLAGGDAAFDWIMPRDEWESIALNYTSGTTGRPKGVVYHHRGAYLITMGTVISWRMVLYPRLLTIVPLFHCNSWCHTWMMPAVGGTVVCCRDITAGAIYDAIADETVTHFGGAPIVLNTIVNAREDEKRQFDHVVEVFTAGAPPPAATLAAIEPLGFNVTQVYGLTEVYGPVTECTWNPDWDDLPAEERYAIKARTGVAMPMAEEVTVLNEDMSPTPRDGVSTGEIMIRGNTVMKGYFRDPKATSEAFSGGYFHSGDVALRSADGYIRITDRAKDVIISGGENISSVEVEGVLAHHPAVLLVSVVAKPDEKWGEVPCAFVELKADIVVEEGELIAWSRERLAGFKTPKQVIFGELPKTSTGKIQKFELRARIKTM